MFLTKFVLIVFTCIELINYRFVSGEDGGGDFDDNYSEEEVEEEKPVVKDNHTFVALLDVVFTDGRKRSCTGTIIHDIVVITAAHCFRNRANPYVEPELTASFVIIGTKKMFETGYEDYLPIERVITHPKYKGWTANIALVYTFSGMTTERPGNIIPLVGERTLTPIDSNVTLLSWGQCNNEESTHTRITPAESSMCNTDDDSCEPRRSQTRSVTGGERYESKSFEFSGADRAGKERSEEDSEPGAERKFKRQGSKLHRTQAINDADNETTKKMGKYMIPLKNYSPGAGAPEKYHADSSGDRDKRLKERRRDKKAKESKSGEVENSQESEIEKENNKFVRHRYHKSSQNTTISVDGGEETSDKHKDLTFRVKKKGKKDPEQKGVEGDIDFEIARKSMPRSVTKSGVKNTTEQRILKEEDQILSWRRQSNGNTKTNQLTVETFGFVNVQQCKKMVERAMPTSFEINPNYVVCYSSDNHFITDEDSGAPAIRQGHLVALTVGGVECEGEHVAIGMKMSCFCPWIAENLPNDAGKDIQCCADCCENESEQKSPKRKHKFK